MSGARIAQLIIPVSAGRMETGLFRCEARSTTEKDPFIKDSNNALPKPGRLSGFSRAARLSHDACLDAQWRRNSNVSSKYQ